MATGRNSSTRVIITGGAQGIGFAVANRLADEGCHAIALIGRDKEKGKAAAAALKAKGVDAIFIRADVADTGACGSAFSEALGHFGSLNALVNAAATSARGSLTDTTPELFDRIFHTNVRGPFFLMQALVRHLLEAEKAGSIVNVLSMSAHCGQSFLAPYSSSKGALATLTKNAANAYRTNRIRVNAVLPGWMDTPGEAVVQAQYHGAGPDWLEKAEAAQPMGQLVKPDQLAGLVAYMLSPESGVMTGSLVDYDQNVAGAFPE
ncbi:SDR family oxidoreductase [Pseudaminobacter sp. 19-2017]|uniref:SDR family oxidoreductase n=1 Tax=Pseudaminobacter soli (ex Zhang et al. 2022) TaxID=2831468 RepID=A0A942DUR9_9HYPH|nr:SDR family oxidoreductase [Pseudaminobacter soli]MBS3647424.1 SDR family oxidoreductase [Pseudaminobacter soli]